MGLMEGKRGIVFGLANDMSIAWGIAQQLKAQGRRTGLHLSQRVPGKTRASAG